VTNELEIDFFNRSSFNGWFRPRLEIEPASSSFSIVNESDEDREFAFSSLPSGSYGGNTIIVVDNQNQIITGTGSVVNLYPYFNMNFLRLKRGNNHLTMTGAATVRFICEFPVDIGG